MIKYDHQAQIDTHSYITLVHNTFIHAGFMGWCILHVYPITCWIALSTQTKPQGILGELHS